jgi:hypothetical protein
MLMPWRLRLDGIRRDGPIAALLAGISALLILAAMKKLGASAALFIPLGVPLVLVLLANPLWMASVVVGLIVMVEGPDFGLSFGSALYSRGVVVNALVALVVLAVAIDVVRSQRRVRLPGPLALPIGLLTASMVVGVITSHASGTSAIKTIRSENILMYLVALPSASGNLDLDRAQIMRALRGWIALAIVKAVLGLAEVAGHFGAAIEGHSTLSYYEPTANWMIMIAILMVFAAMLSGYKPPVWMMVGTPLLIGSLLLSYRRSFWIGSVLAIVLLVMLGLSPDRRRLLVPTIVVVAAAIWLAGSVHFQSQTQSLSPIIRRAESLAPSKLATNVEDSYRLDERANVLATIREHPIVGVGLFVPWSASARPLPIEHEGGRLYVHFAALWFWFKFGLFGLFAYVSLVFACAALSWRVWRTSHEPLVRGFGLASLCATAGLIVIETTGTFTGADPRFTILLSAQLGALALLSRGLPLRGLVRSPDAR